MTQLTDLHRRLWRLRARRRHFRWAMGYSALAIAIAWALAIAFPVDFLFQQSMDIAQRLVVGGLCAAAVVWTFYRYTLPWLGKTETEIDLALLVERDEHIDTDLVAALEFERPEAAGWGSRQMEQAVIDQVAGRGTGLNVMKSLPKRDLSRRLGILGATVAIWALLIVVLPGHVSAFLNRMLLGSQHYPTRTQIDAITVNGKRFEPGDWGQSPVRVRFGEAVRFEVTGSRDLPATGRAVLYSPRSGVSLPIELQAEKDRPGVYLGEHPRLVEAVRCQIHLGDAWTNPSDLVASQLPSIELLPEVIPPKYADNILTALGQVGRGMRDFSVIQGSEVRLKINSDKPLAKAVLTIDDEPYDLVREPTPEGEHREFWGPPARETPLTYVDKLVNFTIQVTDQEDQQLEKPIRGTIRIRADSPPRVAAKAQYASVRAEGQPTVYFLAVDDFAVGRIWFSYEIDRPQDSLPADEGEGPGKAASKTGASEPSEPKQAAKRTGEVKVLEISADSPQRKVEGERQFDLRPLKLVKGDRVKLRVWAQDHRGRREGEKVASEPIVFQVTDEQGILASVREGHKLSARELKTMIQRQLGVGDVP